MDHFPLNPYQPLDMLRHTVEGCGQPGHKATVACIHPRPHLAAGYADCHRLHGPEIAVYIP